LCITGPEIRFPRLDFLTVINTDKKNTEMKLTQQVCAICNVECFVLRIVRSAFLDNKVFSSAVVKKNESICLDILQHYAFSRLEGSEVEMYKQIGVLIL
jgi:predicted protein tyrosine phosphatase